MHTEILYGLYMHIAVKIELQCVIKRIFYR